MDRQSDSQSRKPSLLDYALPTKKRNKSNRLLVAGTPEITTFPLPTKKRVRAYQPEEMHADQRHGYVNNSICEDDGQQYSLPTKKRKVSRNAVCDVYSAAADSVFVSNRKRVCAFEPDFGFGLMLDLNVEYKPSLGDDCLLESDFSSVEIDAMEEVRKSGGFDLGGSIVEDKTRDECVDLEVVSNVVETNEIDTCCDTVEELGVNNGLVDRIDDGKESVDTEIVSAEIEGSRGAEAESLVEEISVELEDPDIASNLGNVSVDEKKTSEVTKELGITNAVNEVEVSISEARDSVEFLNVKSVDKISGVMDGCSHDSNGGDTCFDVAIDGNCDKLVSGSGDKKSVSDSVEVNECKDCEVVQDMCELEGSLAKVESSTEEKPAEFLHLETVSNLDNVDFYEKVTVGVPEELDSCACFEVAAELDGDNLVSGDGVAFDISLATSTFRKGVRETETEHLKEVTKIDDESDDESEDGVVCEICQSTDGDPSDPIVFCDGCDLMVHASCYGNPLIKGIPEGDWFCDKCTFQTKNPSIAISCCLCPSAGGVLKATNDGRWAHIVCAVFVPEAFFLDPQGREGIDVSKICNKRWTKRCYICEKRKGRALDCSEAKCCLSFHVTCGLQEDLCIEYKEGNMKKGGIVAGFCKDHTELWKKQQQTGKFKIVARKGNEM